MKIAYVTTYDAHDPAKWSGLGYHIARSLEMAGCELEYIGPLDERLSTYFRAKTLLYRKLKKQAFQRDREPAILDGYARQVEARLRQSTAQIVFSPGSVPIAHVKTNLPIVFWTDAPYAALQAEYKWELPPTPRSYKNGNAMEQRAIDRAALAIYSSDWAARSAIDRYRANPGKVKVVPFGANVAERPADQIHSMIASRTSDVCRLLFVGTGWERKGGDVAVEVARLLNERGLKTALTIVGRLPDGLQLPSFVTATGFINTSTLQGASQLGDLFGLSHFLILPARAEAFGLVLCEANCFGLPCAATCVGGIPTIIRDGVNGLLFEPDSPSDMADGIAARFADGACYRVLCAGALQQSQQRLNWRVAGEAIRNLLESL